MIGQMIRTRLSLCIVAAALFCPGAVTCFAEAKANPYTGIVDRNPFGLKPPPPPVVETNQEPAVPPPNVKLTGISNLFSKRALLEITEQQAPTRPGQVPVPGGTVNRPILAEGEAMYGVEVVAIDLEKNTVRIRNGGTESDLTFEVPKPSGGGPAAPPAPVGRTASVAPPAVPAMGQPTIVSSAEPRGGVTMLGGGGGFAGNSGGVSSYGAPATPMGGVSTYGGMPMAGNPSLAANNGLKNIPSRTVRTPQPTTQMPAVDRDTQAILIEANRLHHQQQAQQSQNYGTMQNPGFPPLPPTDLTPHLQGNPGGGPGLPAVPGNP